MGRSKEKVAQRIVEHMDPNNKRNTRNNDIDRYVDWRSTLILKETSNVSVENADDDSEPSIIFKKRKMRFFRGYSLLQRNKGERIGIKTCTVRAIKKGAEGPQLVHRVKLQILLLQKILTGEMK